MKIDKIKLVLKGILLYTTIAFCTLSIMAIDSIYDKELFFIDIVLCAVLILACYTHLNIKEVETLSFIKYFGGVEE